MRRAIAAFGVLALAAAVTGWALLGETAESTTPAAVSAVASSADASPSRLRVPESTEPASVSRALPAAAPYVRVLEPDGADAARVAVCAVAAAPLPLEWTDRELRGAVNGRVPLERGVGDVHLATALGWATTAVADEGVTVRLERHAYLRLVRIAGDAREIDVTLRPARGPALRGLHVADGSVVPVAAGDVSVRATRDDGRTALARVIARAGAVTTVELRFVDDDAVALVVLGPDGDRIGGAVARCLTGDVELAATRTDAEGRAELRVPQGVRCEIVATSDDGRLVGRAFVTPWDERTDDVELVLEPAALTEVGVREWPVGTGTSRIDVTLEPAGGAAFGRTAPVRGVLTRAQPQFSAALPAGDVLVACVPDSGCVTAPRIVAAGGQVDVVCARGDDAAATEIETGELTPGWDWAWEATLRGARESRSARFPVVAGRARLPHAAIEACDVVTLRGHCGALTAAIARLRVTELPRGHVDLRPRRRTLHLRRDATASGVGIEIDVRSSSQGVLRVAWDCDAESALVLADDVRASATCSDADAPWEAEFAEMTADGCAIALHGLHEEPRSVTVAVRAQSGCRVPIGLRFWLESGGVQDIDVATGTAWHGLLRSRPVAVQPVRIAGYDFTGARTDLPSDAPSGDTVDVDVAIELLPTAAWAGDGEPASPADVRYADGSSALSALVAALAGEYSAPRRLASTVSIAQDGGIERRMSLAELAEAVLVSVEVTDVRIRRQ